MMYDRAKHVVEVQGIPAKNSWMVGSEVAISFERVSSTQAFIRQAGESDRPRAM